MNDKKKKTDLLLLEEAMGGHMVNYLFRNQTYHLSAPVEPALTVSSLIYMTIVIQTELLQGCLITLTWTMVLA